MTRPSHVFAALLLLVSASGCGSGDGAKPPTAAETFRSELCDPQKHKVRNGGKVDEMALHEACMEFARTHLAECEALFAAGLAKLPDVQLPAAPQFAQVAAMDPGDMKQLERQPFLWALNPDPEILIRMTSGMLAPQMLRSAGLEMKEMAAWMGFLNFARPRFGKLRDGDKRVVLTSDYGGQDVLVMAMTRNDAGWIASELSWWRKK